MPNVIELFRKAKEKLPADKAVVLAAITALGGFALVPIQAFFGVSLHELAQDQPDEALKTLAVAIIGLSTLLSVISEAPTLHKRGYSASPTSTTGQMVMEMLLGKGLEKSVLVSVGAHIVSGALLVGISPGNLLVLANALLINRGNLANISLGDFSRLGLENASGVIMGLTLWRVVFNALIYSFDSKKLYEPAENIYYRLRPDAYKPMNDINKLQ